MHFFYHKNKSGNGKHTIYKNGDDWGMVYGIVLPTLFIMGPKGFDGTGVNHLKAQKIVLNGC